jgi:hypothetical protein
MSSFLVAVLTSLVVSLSEPYFIVIKDAYVSLELSARLSFFV